MYAKYIKRLLDFIIAFIALVVLSPLLLILIIIGAVAMGGNPFFTQDRPGKDEKIFKLIKFRSMNNKKDKDGMLLPDDQRLTAYGKALRASSCDELPELINILMGDMSFVGPRPLLVRDMVFMTPEQRKRHTVRQGLTGLAQANGRNGITWDKKLEYDQIYIKDISFINDVKIIVRTFINVIKKDGITEDGMATAADLGDYLLFSGIVTQEEYDLKQLEAKKILEES
jgi:lipopolysaccharide/colanic/teichoic acid biosynthesis glycosyltransferase